MRRWIARLLVLAVAVASLWVGLRWYFTPDPVTVITVEVERGPVEATITNSRAGTVRVRRRAGLSPETSGTVIAIHHREGDRVERGEVLFQLRDDTLRAQQELAARELELAVAREEQSRIAVDRAHRELQRHVALAREQLVSEDTLDQLRTREEDLLAAHRAASAATERSRAALRLAGSELDRTVVRAPFAGVVAELLVELGEWVTPSPPLFQAPVAVDLLDPSSVYITAPMDEVDAARIHRGQQVKVTVDSHRGDVFPGRVVRVAPFVLDVEQQNRTVEVEVDLIETRYPLLLPGTSADVEIVLEVHPDAVRIPASALFESRKVLVEQDGVLYERTVRVGLRNWDHVEILEGLDPGERVVRSLDRAEIQPGARVQRGPVEAAASGVQP